VARNASVSREPARAAPTRVPAISGYGDYIRPGVSLSTSDSIPLKVTVALWMGSDLSLGLGHHPALLLGVPTPGPVNLGRWSERLRCIDSSMLADRSPKVQQAAGLG